MTERQVILKEVEGLPDEALRALAEFVEALKHEPAGAGREMAMLSQSALAKDWNRPEEDEAWRDL